MQALRVQPLGDLTPPRGRPLLERRARPDMQHRVRLCGPLESGVQWPSPLANPIRCRRRTVYELGDKVAPCAGLRRVRDLPIDLRTLDARTIACERDDPARAHGGGEPGVAVVAGDEREIERR